MRLGFPHFFDLKSVHFSQTYPKHSEITLIRSGNLFSSPIYNRLSLTLDEKVIL